MDKNRLQKIFQKTDGNCHICHGKLSFTNYGNLGSRGAWNIEHSKPKAKGGSDHLNNLYAACISCNTDKGVKHTKTARAKYGYTRAPHSRTKKETVRNDNVLGGGLLGGILGSIFGPVGTLVGAGLGAIIGNENSPAT